MFFMISYSAPAKVILSGEHTVVYGKPALVSAVDLRLTFSIEEHTVETHHDASVQQAINCIKEVVISYLKKKKIVISNGVRNPAGGQQEVGPEHNGTSLKGSMNDELMKDIIQIPHFVRDDSMGWDEDINIQSAIPIGRGMGSSAALSVAGVAAFLHFYTGRQWDKETINSLAYQCEKKFHGNPSGVDNSTSCFGGLIFYRKEFEFLKHISALNFKLPDNIQKHLFLIDTGKPTETTAQMVSSVGKLYNQDPKRMEQIMNQIEKVTKRMVVAIVKEDPKLFAECIAENQTLLEHMEVVSESTKALLKEFSEYGVGKVTGAGGKETGSGFVLFFAADANEFEKMLDKKSITYFKFVQSLEGVEMGSDVIARNEARMTWQSH
jgi:mevalonate kinase